MSAAFADLRIPQTLRPSLAGLSLGSFYLRILAALLAGYALAGKGFAYLGVGHVYLGEIVLALGIAVVLATNAWRRLPRSPALLFLLLFMTWGLVRTLPGASEYGVEALRDAVLWAYGLFAIVVASLVAARPQRVAWLLARYSRFAGVFLALAPALFLLQTLFGDALPRVPGSDVAVVQLKEGDVLTQLAGVAGVLLLGLAPTRAWSLPVLLASVIGLSVYSRGAMLAFGLSLGFLAAMRPLRRRLWVAAAAVMLAAPLLWITETGLFVKGREVSGQQIVENLASVFVRGGSEALEGTTAWRLRWWSEIVEDTVRGPYFWTGKGFGVNLATDNGFDVDAQRSLRSPHNGHVTVLARMGVPGLLLWCALQLAWLREMALAYRASRRRGDARWPRLFLLLIACWIAHLVNATFDVYLEGPMGGIWFWTIFGVGLAAARIQRRHPAALEPTGYGASAEMRRLGRADRRGPARRARRLAGGVA
jgi:hypothetical protein